MIDLAVQLVAHPVAHSRLPQELASPLDEVIEVSDSCRALCLGVCRCERLPGAESGGHVRGKPGTILNAQQIAEQISKTARVSFIVWLGPGLACRDAQRALFRENDLAQSRQGDGPFDR